MLYFPTKIYKTKKKIEPNTVIKFGIGFLFLSLGFFLFYSLRFFANDAGQSSLNLFTFTWLVTRCVPANFIYACLRAKYKWRGHQRPPPLISI